ncbi:YbhB/YbcL family Raf kinase inhibitor-like protein [candidate division GN15 bacterium]|nr:YbhB/YbcL family Raf kinase inhibitor-like protein [candidate division GN15 bacterium]
MAFTLKSTAFSNEETIPDKYTCQGNDISPPLQIEGVPENTKSMALIVDDPDAPNGTFTHWVLYNLNPETTELREAMPPDERVQGTSLQGMNDFNRVGYGGPCPPSGTHRYYFKLYALDTELDLESKATKTDVESAIRNHVLAETQLMGKFSK